MQQFGLMTRSRSPSLYIYSCHCNLCGAWPIRNALGYVGAVLRKCKHLMEMKKYIHSCVLTALYTILY